LAFGGLYVGVLRRFAILRLDIATAETMVPFLQPGHRHLIDRRLPHALRRSWVVWWRYNDGTLFDRIVACPGDRFFRRDGRWHIQHAGAASGAADEVLRPEIELDDAWQGRTIGLDEYVLLPDRLGLRWPDSRQLGPIARSAIVARVVLALGGNRQ